MTHRPYFYPDQKTTDTTVESRMFLCNILNLQTKNITKKHADEVFR